ncbi:MAG: triphosphoribosyl-dephospho-CoA synthase CitG [Clostridiales bacterium]|nr:triphosphoribosyl-dephospho-CoA synthase CitG [Clostridiales bacterium]
MEQQVSLSEMLDARERRAASQRRLLETYHETLLCFTMNIAGPIKNGERIRGGFEIGKRRLEDRLRAAKIGWTAREEINEKTGNEIIYVLAQDPLKIKKIAVEIEEESTLGRLFDMDVLRSDGTKADRGEIGLPGRRCLICGRAARECARSRTHTVEELQEKTMQILDEAINETDAQEAARRAVSALLYEVCTTPKPGLVDCMNSGSHRDMTIFTFMDSSVALYPYFRICTQIGRSTAMKAPGDTFVQLRRVGKRAEADMFAATKGVNTHKGAIFSMGILCAALGRLPRRSWNNPETIVAECAAMTHGIVAADFAGLTPENAVTTGQKLYLEYGITGVRGQMESGLPAVLKFGLPILRRGVARGLNINDAGAATLLALMIATTDTNLIARSDIETQQKTVAELKELLAENPYPERAILERLDQSFTEKNLSPGGSADLLAICYFLYFLESEEEECPTI